MLMGTKKYCFFWKNYLSQWNMTPFVYNGVTYNCAEQAMMASKALLFNDLETHSLIMKASEPKEQKRLGRLVKNFKENVWNKHCKTIVEEIKYSKFKQNPKLLEKLLKTEGILVEASPFDQIWGIGLTEDDPRALDESTWRGKNWLGECLVNVREKLKGEMGMI